MLGTKGIVFYPEYMTPINSFQSEDDLITTNNSSSYRVVFIEDGIGSLCIDGIKITVLPNTLLCLNEKENVSQVEVSGIKMFLLCFHPAAINNNLSYDKMNNDVGLTISDSQDKQFFLPFILRNSTYKNFISIPMETSIRLIDILNNLNEQLFVQSDSWPCLSRSYLIELLFLIERSCRFQATAMESPSNKSKLSVDDLLLYIHSNYMHKITINDLIKMNNTNRTTLSKEFKGATGQTIVTYIIKVRIQIAAAMLRDTSMSVSVIIDRVGFNNITHFNKIFKEYTHCLPNEYRKNACSL